jgi:hypothetical protein
MADKSNLMVNMSASGRACLCCGAGQIGQAALPFCKRCLSGMCGKRCRRFVRITISERYPTAINLIGRSPGPRMRCGWECGAKLTTSEMRGHFTKCSMRPKILESIRPLVDSRGGRPRGPTMPCGWLCGTKLTATEMRRHFVLCPKRPRLYGVGVFL